jgi:hypothetical protein
MIYASAPFKGLVGTARIVAIDVGPVDDIWREHGVSSAISRHEYDAYFAGAGEAVAIRLETSVRYRGRACCTNCAGLTAPSDHRKASGISALRSSQRWSERWPRAPVIPAVGSGRRHLAHCAIALAAGCESPVRRALC